LMPIRETSHPVTLHYPSGPLMSISDTRLPAIRVGGEVSDNQEQPREDYKEMPTREASPDMTNYNDSLALEVRFESPLVPCKSADFQMCTSRTLPFPAHKIWSAARTPSERETPPRLPRKAAYHRHISLRRRAVCLPMAEWMHWRC
jgi:hypothetical protein